MQAPNFQLEDYIVVDEGAPLLLMMEDGTIMEFLAMNAVRENAYTVSPEDQSYDTNMHVTRALATIKFPLDASTAKELASQPVTKVRVTTANRRFDFEIHKNSREDFKKAVECIFL